MKRKPVKKQAVKRPAARAAKRTAAKAARKPGPPAKATTPRPPRDPVARGDLMADSVAATSVIDLVKYDERGLVPVVAQDLDGTVLMLAWANRAALDETLATGRGTYWSRSRQELWRKGDTSGHTQEVIRVAVDCDGDSVLYTLKQTGPACHTGQRSCFFATQDL
jgi:phosphoribosyl-AMP cyclohydrolase